jgi:hypothetical protein
MNLTRRLALGAGAAALVLTGCSVQSAPPQYEQVCLTPQTLVVYALTGSCPWTPYYVPYGYFYAHPAYFSPGHTTNITYINASHATTTRPRTATIYSGTGRSQTATSVSGGKVSGTKTVKAGSSGLIKPGKTYKAATGSTAGVPKKTGGLFGSSSSRKSSFGSGTRSVYSGRRK